MYLRAIILTLMLIWSATSIAREAKIGVFIDGSGSMSGFMSGENSIDMLVNQYRSAASSEGIVDYTFFVSMNDYDADVAFCDYSIFPQPRDSRGLKQQCSYGNTTLLDKALNEIINRNEYDIIFMLTDNVQTGKEDDKDPVCLVLNQEVKTDDSSHEKKRLIDGKKVNVIIEPELAFNGKVYLDKDKLSLPKVTTEAVADLLNEKKVHHQGDIKFTAKEVSFVTDQPRNLITYSILLNKEYSNEYERIHQNLKDHFDKKLLKVYPYTKQDLGMDVVESEEAVRKYYESIGREFIQPNMILKKNSAGEFILVKSERFAGADISKNVKIIFYIKLAKQFENIDITDGKLTIDAKGVGAEGHNYEHIPSRIYPEILMEKFDQNNQTQYYRIEILVEGRETKYIDTFRFSESGSFNLDMTIRLVLKDSNFKLSDSFRDKYFSKSLFDLSKIYARTDFIQYLQPKETKVNLGINASFPRYFPWLPGLLSVLAGALAIFLGHKFLNKLLYVSVVISRVGYSKKMTYDISIFRETELLDGYGSVRKSIHSGKIRYYPPEWLEVASLDGDDEQFIYLGTTIKLLNGIEEIELMFEYEEEEWEDMDV